MNKFKIAIAILCVAALGYGAVKQAKYSLVNDPNPQVFQAGVYVGGPYSPTDPTLDTHNKFGHHYCGTLVYDFPAASGSTVGLSTVCQSSTPDLTIKGCAFNDRLTIGVDQTPANKFGQIDPLQITATTFEARVCGIGLSDAGTINMPDASYTICCDGY